METRSNNSAAATRSGRDRLADMAEYARTYGGADIIDMKAVLK